MQRIGKFTRRDFLAESSKTAAALSVGSLFLGQTAASAARTFGANETIRVGVIGAGGQGTSDCAAVCGADNVVCVALCDVAEFRLAEATARITKAMESKGHKNVKIDHYADYRQLLDRGDIDAVIIATPDHWHRLPFLASVEAGKHIYQEKPFSFTYEQGMEMVAAAEKKPELVIQIGTQRRSDYNNAKAKQLLDDGVIGEVKFVRAKDCRNFVTGRDPFAPRDVQGKIDWDKFQEPCNHKVPYDPWRYFAWRWFWDYAGGLVTDVGVHVIDIVHYYMDNPVPRSAVCNGGVYGLDYWETPDVVNAVWEYDGFSLNFVSNFTNGFEGDGLTLFGTKGTIDIRGSHIRVYSEGQADKPIHEFAKEGPAHQHNWVECMRTGKKPNAPVQLGFSSLLPSHMANIAYRSGRKVAWDPQARKIVPWEPSSRKQS
ncbi:MAG TPA: Gfo/Idh/MocA family oxidoreductase [Phycisphaerae bacterium]|nr:Gfo/Idh/MocA family oxidoreductase [Phycisphaerae bacterium]HRR86352.1 Gfo/Idh/MocA family oxidoreductase [Phycisphaerae bacterium]